MKNEATIPLEAILEDYLRKYAGGGVVAVGLSGGVDSLVLCEALLRAKASVVALHFNHHWRDKESDADEKWVVDWCKKKGIPIYCGHAVTRGATSENVAREQRFNFFKKKTLKLGIRQLWLGHHGDDVVETFLMQLMRGSGPGGLAGIRDVREMDGLPIIRPFTGIFKEELEKQARRWNLKWRQDSSNKNPKYLRNRVRLGAIPALSKAMGRDVRASILKAALLLADENEDWQSRYPSVWPEKLKVADLKKMSVAAQRRWLYRWLESRKVPDIDFSDIENVRALLTNLKPSKINLSKGLHCRRREGVLFIEK